MFGISTPLFVAAALSGLIVLLGVGTFLFQASCALVDTTDRGYLRSLGTYSVAVVVCLPLAVILVRFAGTYDTDPNTWLGSMRIAGILAALLLTWMLSALIYTLFLAGSLKKGLLIAGVDLVLMGLLTAFVSAIVLVILAVVQIVSRPPPVKLSAISYQLSAKPKTVCSLQCCLEVRRWYG